KRINHELDFDYIDGTIIIEYYDHFFMDFRFWELVDQLWCYFILLLEEVLQTGYGMTYFPAQPLKMEMKIVSNCLLLFSLDEGRKIRELLPMYEFMTAILKGAEIFYSSFTLYFDRKIDFSYELNKIHDIKVQLKCM